MKPLGFLVASVPVIFALLRAITTGTDFRYFWLALASTLGAALILVTMNRTVTQPHGTMVRIAFALLVATGTTGVTGFALGGGSAPALIVVALGFATCSAVGLGLALRGSRAVG